jgi:hypothetical protein
MAKDNQKELSIEWLKKERRLKFLSVLSYHSPRGIPRNQSLKS